VGCTSLNDLSVGRGDADTSNDGGDTTDGAVANGPGDGASSGDSGLSDESGPSGPCNAYLSSDPKNCGRCGHDCLGGTCIAGRCQPLILLDSQMSGILRVRAGTLYWASGEGITSCEIASCPATRTPLVTRYTGISAFVLGSNNLVFINSSASTSGVLVCPFS